MKLLMLGAHQRTTPVALLERFTFSAETLPRALEELRSIAAESMIVSTCNRVEVYALAPDIAEGTQALERFLHTWHDTVADETDIAWTALSEEAVVRHIFRLAAGLDSMVLGDDQIMGQLKAAYAAAHEAGTAGKVLHRLVSRALASGKLVRTRTRIGSHPVSVVSVALDQAQRQFGNLSDRRCLVIGAGHMAQLALKLLSAKQVSHLSVINRTDERAETLAERYHARSWRFAEMERALAAHDVIICATAAPGFVVTRAILEGAVLADHPDHARLFLDLSVPRGIEPAGLHRPQDHLFDIDALQAISARNHGARAAEIESAEALIEPEVRAFMEWLAAQSVVPTIRELRAYAEDIRAAELRRALAHLPTLSEEEQQTIQALTTAIVNKLLHHPIMALKDPADGPQLAQTLNRVFQLSQSHEENI